MFKRSGTVSFSLFVPESHALRLESTESDSFSPSIPSNAAEQPGSAVCIATEARHHLHGGREPSTPFKQLGTPTSGRPKHPFWTNTFHKKLWGSSQNSGYGRGKCRGTLGKSPFMYRVYHNLGYPMVILIGVRTLKMLFGSLTIPKARMKETSWWCKYSCNCLCSSVPRCQSHSLPTARIHILLILQEFRGHGTYRLQAVSDSYLLPPWISLVRIDTQLQSSAGNCWSSLFDLAHRGKFHSTRGEVFVDEPQKPQCASFQPTT